MEAFKKLSDGEKRGIKFLGGAVIFIFVLPPLFVGFPSTEKFLWIPIVLGVFSLLGAAYSIRIE